MSYRFSTVSLNNREIRIADILSSRASALTSFEHSTFSFIRDWLNERQEFTLQTSGSTGSPKEITLTRRQLQQSALRTIKAIELKEGDSAFVCLDTKYTAGKMMLARALEGNMKISGVEPSANPLLGFGKDSNYSLAAFVPLQLKEILKHPESQKTINQFKVIIVGGANVDVPLEKEISTLNCEVYATYGMTETVSHIALQKLTGTNRSNHFTALPGIQLSIDERGCLTIDIPEFSNTISTNDLAELISPTTFRWLGRIDNVINSGGYKISPEKIETILSNIFSNLSITRSFIVLGLPDKQFGQQLIIAIEGFPIPEEKKLISEIKKLLHPYEVPKQIFYIREFTRTETGKINRAKTISNILQSNR